MGRYRSRSRSYSPRRRASRSPPPRKRYDEPRDRYRGAGHGFRDRRPAAPTGLLIRNVALDARSEDLRIPFERFGPVKDVYLPKNYYTGEPRGFGFVKFRNPEDAAIAKQEMNHQIIGGREISIVFAEENRKTPQEMRMTTRISDRYNGGSYRRRSPPRSPRPRYHTYSRSATPPGHDPRGYPRSSRNDYYMQHGYNSPSPRDDRQYRPHHRSSGHEDHGRSPSRSRSYSPH